MVTPRRKLRRRLATRSSHFATYILNQKTSYPGPAPRMSGLPFSLERVAVSMGTDAFFFLFLDGVASNPKSRRFSALGLDGTQRPVTISDCVALGGGVYARVVLCFGIFFLFHFTFLAVFGTHGRSRYTSIQGLGHQWAYLSVCNIAMEREWLWMWEGPWMGMACVFYG